MATQVDPATLPEKFNSRVAAYGSLDAQPEVLSNSLTKVVRDSAPPMTAQFRRELISVAAYILAEQRGFEPGHEMEDWLAAEAQVDARNAAS